MQVSLCVIKSAVMRVEFVTDRVSYIILTGRLCDIMLSYVHDASEDEIDDMMDSFHEEVERVSDNFPHWHINIFRRFQ
jgi:DNA polymerase II small subunit/DNA polymerase delta subunit B